MADHVDLVLAQWATERPDLDMAPMGIIGRLLRLSRVLDVELDRTFRQHGLDRPAFDVLATLRRAGRPNRLTPTELMRASMVTSGAITQRLGRVVHVALTDEGRALIDRALPDHLANEDRLLAALTKPQRKALADTLRRLL